MEDLRLVTYCGLYCGLCAQRGRIPRQASALRASMANEGYEFWGQELPNFNEFWSFLTDLCDPDKACPGCRQGGGPPFCGIRKCARQRGVEVCVFCEEYPCKRVLGIAKGYPTLIADGQRIREMNRERLSDSDRRWAENTGDRDRGLDPGTGEASGDGVRLR